MICSNCGNEMTPGQTFCGICGAKAPVQAYADTAQMNTNTGAAQMQWQNPYVQADNTMAVNTQAENIQPQVQNNYGAVQNYAAAQDYGTAQNYGTTQNYGATQNYDATQNYAAAQNYGATQNYGTTQNYGVAQNYDTTQNYGTAQNYGTTQNYGATQNYGTDQNYGMAQSYAAAQNYGYQTQNYNYNAQTYSYPNQRDTFYVRKLPMVVIAILTAGFLMSSFFFDGGSTLIASVIPIIQGVVLMVLIYKLDRIEPEPISLLAGLFIAGATIVPIVVMIVELILGVFVGIIAYPGTIVYSILEAFLIAATTEELGKYAALRLISWKHPAFNFRFDGIVYSTTVAIGFQVIESVLYVLGSSFGTALARSAFPGHCVFGIYMGYYYGQAKSLERKGDLRGASNMRIRGVVIAILFHGFYDAVVMVAANFGYSWFTLVILIMEVAVMSVLNISAYKNIKEFAREDMPV